MKYWLYLNFLDFFEQEIPTSPEKDVLPRVGGKGVQYPFSVNERVMIKVISYTSSIWMLFPSYIHVVSVN